MWLWALRSVSFSVKPADNRVEVNNSFVAHVLLSRHTAHLTSLSLSAVREWYILPFPGGPRGRCHPIRGRFYCLGCPLTPQDRLKTASHRAGGPRLPLPPPLLSSALPSYRFSPGNSSRPRDPAAVCPNHVHLPLPAPARPPRQQSRGPRTVTPVEYFSTPHALLT